MTNLEDIQTCSLDRLAYILADIVNSELTNSVACPCAYKDKCSEKLICEEGIKLWLTMECL